MASIVAGERVTPVLLPDATRAPAKGGTPITAGEAGQLREMMRAVVTDGSATFPGDNPGGPVIAKTGTAEYGSATPPRTHARMFVARDDLAVAVFVEDGSGGAKVAGPIADRYTGLVRR
nr:penicillin-binding transpeptidase domain-containing protein [Janibacter limosus]